MRKARSDAAPQESLAEMLERLRGEHRELEDRLQELDRNLYLTPNEQFERKRIQKLKLQKKDQIASLTRELQTPQS